MTVKRCPSPQLLARLRIDEGLRLTSYLCSAGHITIGYGHNMEARPIPGIPTKLGVTITRDQAERLLVVDAQDACNDVLRRWSWAADLAPARFDVLVNMVFNMGAGEVADFRRFLAALRAGDSDTSVREMYNSKWAHQVGDGPGGKVDRVDRLAAWVRSGQYLEAA